MFKALDVISKDSILSIPDIENRVFSFYIPEYASGNKLFKSIFRRENNKSANIIRVGDTLLYKDFGDEKALNIISFVRKLYNCDTDEALSRINQDLNLGLHSNSTCREGRKTTQLGTPSSSTILSLKVKKRPWNKADIEYWGSYHLTIEWLEEAKIFPISHIFLEKIEGTTIITAEKLAYTFDFYFNNGSFRRKIYQPLSKDFKWLSNIDSTVVQNIKNIPESGDNLIITKGLKDAICWSKIAGIPSIASNNEATIIPEKVIEKKRKQFKNLYINYDNDETGAKFSKLFSKRYNLIEIVIPKIEGVKDFSDFVKKDIYLALKFRDEIFNKNV